jgi:hypothetical protein
MRTVSRRWSLRADLGTDSACRDIIQGHSGLTTCTDLSSETYGVDFVELGQCTREVMQILVLIRKLTNERCNVVDEMIKMYSACRVR